MVSYFFTGSDKSKSGFSAVVSSKTSRKGDKPEKGAKSRATQQRIIDAFERVLLRDGVAGVGINAIVAEAGVGKGLIYHHLDGLEGLAEACQFIVPRTVVP